MASTPPAGGRPAAEIADFKHLRLTEAASIAKAERERGRLIDGEIADLLLHELEQNTTATFLPQVGHLLDLLSELGAERLILPFKATLIASADPLVRAKATLLIGRTLKSIPWLSRRTLDPDPRVQANAIEALWGVEGPDAREILESSLKSPHAPVIANTLVALYRMGDIASVPLLVQMAGHTEESFRVSARWAMGETGDPRFFPYLTAAFRTDAGECHGMTLRALARLRRRLTALEQAGQLSIRVWGARIAPGGTREIGISLLLGLREKPLALGPTSLVITEASRLITEYTFAPVAQPDLLVVGFVIPRILSEADPYRLAIERGITRCISVKHKQDLWVLDRFLSGAQAETEQRESLTDLPEDHLLLNHIKANRGFLTDPAMIAKLIPGDCPRDTASQDLTASLQKVMRAQARVVGTRHAFVFLDPERAVPDAALASLANEAQESDIAIEGMALDSVESSAAFEALCAASGGSFTKLPPDRMVEELSRVHEGLRNRYRICYPDPGAAGDAVSAEVSLYSSDGWGKIVVTLPPAPSGTQADQ